MIIATLAGIFLFSFLVGYELGLNKRTVTVYTISDLDKEVTADDLDT